MDHGVKHLNDNLFESITLLLKSNQEKIIVLTRKKITTANEKNITREATNSAAELAELGVMWYTLTMPD